MNAYDETMLILHESCDEGIITEGTKMILLEKVSAAKKGALAGAVLGGAAGVTYGAMLKKYQEKRVKELEKMYDKVEDPTTRDSIKIAIHDINAIKDKYTKIFGIIGASIGTMYGSTAGKSKDDDRRMEEEYKKSV